MKKIFNFFNINLLTTPIVFIELNEKQLILAHAKKRRLSGSIYIINVSSINIEQTSFRNGIIYMPSIIGSNISEFLAIQKLCYPKALVSIPDLAKKHDLLLVLAILQATLCISKAKVKISSIMDCPFFDAQKNLLQVKNKYNNLLDHLGNNKIRSPFPWILGSIICLVILIIVLKNTLYTNAIQIASIKNQITDLQQSTAKLEKQVKNFAQIKESNAQIKNSLSKLEHSYANTQNPFKHIMEIASKMPATAYLTKINFSKKLDPTLSPCSIQKDKIKKPNFTYLELEGQAKSIRSANHFIRILAENTNLFKKIDILYVKKVKNSNKSKTVKNDLKNTLPKYQFKAVGELKYIC